MKQLWFVSDNKIELLEKEIPPVGRRQVKVKIAYAALCATDVHIVTMGLMGIKPPVTLGHEASGVVVELGEATENSGLKVGDKVCLFPSSFCGMCPACKSGHGQYCQNGSVAGAFAEYVATDISAVFKLPDDADLKASCLVEPANCTIRAMDLAQVRHGATVAVSGVGGIGSIMLNMLLLSGAARITAIDPVESKRRLALDMGAQYVINPLTESIEEQAREITAGAGFDYVFEMSGSPKAAVPALNIMGRCGTVVYFAVYPPEYTLPLNLFELYRKEGRLQTVFTSPAIMPRTIQLIPRLQTDKIIGTVLPLRDGAKSFELFHQSIYPKILLDCSEAAC
jgi:(R,R)-butanediol dehydrogenase/meso-butanediol dehydrogenase/diacetyl reductase